MLFAWFITNRRSVCDDLCESDHFQLYFHQLIQLMFRFHHDLILQRPTGLCLNTMQKHITNWIIRQYNWPYSIISDELLMNVFLNPLRIHKYGSHGTLMTVKKLERLGRRLEGISANTPQFIIWTNLRYQMLSSHLSSHLQANLTQILYLKLTQKLQCPKFGIWYKKL